jgi:ubiquinone/menaquinone biosynthesis C-methylase UbiE
MSDWDAAKYHRISDPQLAWGRAVAARLAPVAGERILDVGCGTGGLT